MALAPLAYLLYRDVLRHNPADPHWPGRDRFILSAGHACDPPVRLAAPAGYDVTLDDLQQFRQWGSRTPGHPELGHTPGIETTTGPLGQGFANGVGHRDRPAIPRRALQPAGTQIVDSRIYGICSDGDLMEGVAQEAASIAGHLGLGRLVYVYDDNHITIDGTTSLSFATEDKGKRFEAYGWHVQHVGDAEDLDALLAALTAAKAEEERPSLIVLRSHIGYPAPHAIDTAKAHGAPLGDAEVRATKERMGFDPDATFVVDDDVRAEMAPVRERGAELQRAWEARLAAWATAFPELARERELDLARAPREGWREALPVFPSGEDVATRDAGKSVMQALKLFTPTMIGGAADLVESTKTEFEGAGVFSAAHARPQYSLRDPRARHGVDRERHRARAGDAAPVRLDVPDLLRLHAACGATVGPDGPARVLGVDARLGRGSARTARRTSRSSTTWPCGRSRTSGTSAPGTRTRRQWRGGSRSSVPTARSPSR